MPAVCKPMPHQRRVRPRETDLVIEPVESGSNVGSVMLAPGKCLLGSSADCTLSLPAGRARPEHCLIITSQNRSLLRSLDTDTWLNEGRVSSAVLRPGDRLTVGSVHLRVRAATMDERIETPADSTRANGSGSRRAASSRGADDRLPVDSLHEELQQQLAQLRTDVGIQQRKIADVLERQSTAVAIVAQQQVEANESDERLEMAQRKDALLSDLLLSLESRAEELCAQDRELSTADSRRQDELSRRENEAAIESALVRFGRGRLALREQEVEDHLAQNQEQTHEWEEARRRSEQALTERARKTTELEADLLRRKAELDQGEEELRQQQAESRRQRDDLYQRDQNLKAEQQRHVAEHESRKQALSARLTRMAHWEAAVAQRQSELDNLTETLTAGEESLREQTADSERHRDRVADTVEDQLSLQSELDALKKNLDQQKQHLQERADELEQNAAGLEAKSQQLNEQAAEQAAANHDGEVRLAQLDERAGKLASEAESLERRNEAVEQQEKAIAERKNALEVRQAEFVERQREFTQQQQEAEHRRQDEQKRADKTRAELAELKQAHHQDVQRQAEVFTRREEELSKLRGDLESERIALESGSEELAVQKNLLAEERRQLEQSRKSVADAEQEFEREMARVRDEQESLRRDQQKLADSQDLCTQQQQELELRTQQLKDSEEEVESARLDLQRERDSLGQQRRALAEQQTLLEADRQSVDELRAELKKQQHDHEQNREQIKAEQAELAASLSALETEREKLEAERENFEEERGSLETERKNFETEREALNAVPSELQTERDSLEALREEIHEQRALLDAEADRLEAERQQLAEEDGRLTALGNQHESLWQTLSDEQVELAQLRRQLEVDRDVMQQDSVKLVHKSERFSSRETDLAYRELELERSLDLLNSERERFSAEQEMSNADGEHLGADRAFLAEELEKLETQKRQAAVEAQALASDRAAIEDEQAQLDLERTEIEADRQHLQAEWNALQSERETPLLRQPPQTPTQTAPEAHSVWADEFTQNEDVDAFGSERESGDTARHAPHPADSTDAEPDGELDRPADDLRTESDDLLSLFHKCAEETLVETPPVAPTIGNLGDGSEASPIEADEPDQQAPPSSDLSRVLADMFDIAADDGEPGSEAGRDDDEGEGVHTAEDASPSASARNESLTSLLESLGRDSALSADDGPAPPPLTDQTAEASSEEPDESLMDDRADEKPTSGSSPSANADDPDSIASYMEQLLARSRQSSDSAIHSGPRTTAPTTSSTDAEQPTTIDSPPSVPDVPAISEEAGPAQQTPTAAPAPLSTPVHQQDKMTVRADLNSLRELANLSARTAIANHSSKAIRGNMFFKSLLAVISFTVSGVLMTGEIWGIQSYEATGWAAVMVSIIIAIELTRSTLLVHRVKSIAESPDTDGKQRQSVGAPENHTTTLTDVATEAIEVDPFILDDDILDDDVFVEE